MLSTLFGWLIEPDRLRWHCRDQSGALVVGLAHFRSMPSPLRAAEIGFLDDLFVDPAARGSGAAEALLKEVDWIAGERVEVVRWITRDKRRARGLGLRCTEAGLGDL